MKKILATLLVVLPFAAANAAEGSMSEYLYQTEGGKQDLTFTLANESDKTEMKTGSDVEIKGTTIAAEYEYGLNEMVSLGAMIGYGTGTYDDGTEIDVKGLTDLDLFVKANTPMTTGVLRYGANLEVSLGDHKVDSNGDENLSSGGMTLYPWIGYEVAMDPCIFGAKLTVPVGLGKKKVNDETGSDYKYEGNEDTELALFYEHKFDESMRIGADLSYVTVSDTDVDGGSSSENISPIYRLGVYLPTAVGAGTLLPRLMYGTSSYDKNNVDSYSELALQVGYRMVF